MFSIFLVLITVVCFLLIVVIMVQNPKGGGLAGNIAGISNQFMGVKQTNDVLERGTWVFSAAIALLCLFSTFFMTTSKNEDSILNKINTNQSASPAQQTAPQTTPPVAPATRP